MELKNPAARKLQGLCAVLRRLLGCALLRGDRFDLDDGTEIGAEALRHARGEEDRDHLPEHHSWNSTRHLPPVG